jgi:hypothetical protein
MPSVREGILLRQRLDDDGLLCATDPLTVLQATLVLDLPTGC